MNTQKSNWPLFLLFLIIISSCNSTKNQKIELDLIPVKTGDLYQYINKENKVLINPQFKEASVFSEDLALVITSEKEARYGFINEDGKYVINPKYKEATVFNEGVAWVFTENKKLQAIDKKGKVKITLEDALEVKNFKDGLAAFKIKNKDGLYRWGFINKEGEVVIKPQYRSVSNFNDDLCAVENHEKKWGFINKEGEVVINYQFDDAKDFENGKCVVQLSEKKGLINDDGKFIINPQFSEMKIDGDLCLIIKGGKWGWTNSEGKIIIEPQFDHADPFKTNNITSVRLNDKYGYIDRNGKIIIDFQFDVALPFFNEIAPVINSNKFGFIGKDGLYVINPVLEDIPDDLISYLLKGRSLYSEINTDYLKFKLKKKSDNKSALDYSCLEKGERLYRVNEKVYSDLLKVKPNPKNISGFGCILDYTGDNGKGVEYNLKFAEDPNLYNIYFKGTNFKIGQETDLYNLLNSTKDEKLIKLLEKNYSDFKIEGKYSMDRLGNVGIYYATIVSYKEKDGKNVDVDLALETKQGSSFFKQIIESFEASDYCLKYWKKHIVFKTGSKKMSTKESTVKVVSTR